MPYENEVAQLKASSQRIKQHAGCCGFASTVIAMAQLAPNKLAELMATVFEGSMFGDVPKSTEVKARVQKRFSSLAVPIEKASLSTKLAIGLMVLLKEHLKDRDPEIWEKTLEFSTALFNVGKTGDQEWIYGGHLGDNPGPRTLSFSYKHGDLALTVPATECLLRLGGLVCVESFPLLDTAQLKNKGSLLTYRNDESLKRSLLEILGLLGAKTYGGAFIGLAKRTLCSLDEHEQYGYLAHWVYLPSQDVPADPWHAATWTWGRELTLDQLINYHGRDYTPIVAIAFKKEGAGAQFA